MATRINPNYYGAESTFITIGGSTAVKRCANNVGQLMTNNIYTGGSFDTTASPWGIGESSVSSDFFFIASKGAEWSIVDYNNPKKNNPIWFYWNSGPIEGGDDTSDLDGSSASSWYYSRAIYKDRMSPKATVSNAEIHSTLAIDNTERVDLPGSANQYPVTYADYQNLRLVIGDVWVKQEGSSNITRTSMSAIQSGSVTVDKLVRFNFSIYDVNENNTTIQLSMGGTEMDIPETFKTCYYESEEKWVRPWHRISSVGYWYRSYYDQSVGFQVFNTDTGVAYTSAWETLSSDDNAVGRPGSNGWGHISSKEQEFDDVSYHWTWGITHWNTDPFVINQIENGDTFTSETLRNFAFMEFDNEPDDKNEACFNAVLHEVAFLGFPIVISTSDVAEPIGSDKVYLPIFDEHLITTGEFANGTAAAALPNAAWRDVFGSEMPEYDPTYDPDEHPEDDQKDEGDLNNLSSARMPSLFSELTFYAMTPLEFYGFIDELNRYYQTRDPEQWTLDFQGSNPADYILGVYYTWFDLPINDVAANVRIGPITLPNTTCFKVAEGDTMLRPNRWQYCDFGTKHIDKRRYDFRDYAPYTQIELYLPLAGTIDLDVAYVMDHDISIRYYYNLLTMTGVACVFRDNLLYKTADLQIGSQIPLLSTNVGQYQNQIAQLEAARKQNAIRLVSGAASVAAGAAATIATGGAALPAALAIGAGASTLATGMIQQDQINYQLEHTAPSVSTTGAAEANCNLCCGQIIPKLIIKRALTLEVDNSMYASTIGNACCFNDTIGNRTGLVVCGGVDTSGIPATVEEINAIKQALSSGVYV